MRGNAPVKAENSSGISRYEVLCASIGAFVGFLLPITHTLPPNHPGFIAAIIAFEMNRWNLITTLGALLLVYVLLKRKVRGREALVLYGGLGLVCVRLSLASLYHK